MPSSHALLSPSAAHRWLNCTAAPHLEENVQDNGSDFAAEGSLAHAYCAKKLKDFLGVPTIEEQDEIAELSEKYHSGEMDEYTDAYATIVLEKLSEARKTVTDAELLVETRLEFNDYVPGAFGTSDAIIISDDLMEVIDFKYGKGVKVSAVDNPQMMIYALGAYCFYCEEYNIKRVRMTIIQPRLDNLSEFELSVDSLLDWAENTLKPKAKEAYGNDGTQKPGAWCQFCKVKSQCRALAEKVQDDYNSCDDPKLLTCEEMAIMLHNLPLIKTWLTGLEDFALQQALAGTHYPGWKIVEGRSVRKIVNQDGAADALNEAGYKTTDIFKPKELRTITDLEKLVGKKLFAEICGDYIEKPKGKPTLAPESDKRPAMEPASDFAGIEIPNN